MGFLISLHYRRKLKEEENTNYKTFDRNQENEQRNCKNDSISPAPVPTGYDYPSESMIQKPQGGNNGQGYDFITNIYETTSDDQTINIFSDNNKNIFSVLNYNNCSIRFDDKDYDIAFTKIQRKFPKKGKHTVVIKIFNKKEYDFSFLFYGCKELVESDISNINFKKISKISKMFYSCSNLEKIIGSEKLDTTNCRNSVIEVFKFCKKLEVIRLNSKICNNLIEDINKNKSDYNDLDIVLI